MLNRHRLATAVSMTLAVMVASPAFAADIDVAANNVSIAEGSTAAAAAAPDATTLDRLVVRPQLEAQVRAIDLKRDSNAILDAVAADDVGDYPDQNVAESVSRLPGVSVTRDQGEGRYVVVRGLDAALNSVTVDGLSIGTPESDNRSTPLDLIPSESTERLKVVKSPTPDMPGDSIGGAIEIESASAFDRDGRSIRAKVEANHQDLSGNTSPKGSFNYSDLFADNTFGVAFGINYQDRKFESDNTEGEYDELDNGDMFMIQQQRRKYYVERKRIGANLNLDWHPNEDSKYYLRTLYSDYQDAETRQNTVIDFDAGDVVANGDGTYSAPVDDLGKRVRYRTKKQNAEAVSFGGENRLPDTVLDYQVGYSKTEERVNDEMEARFKLASSVRRGLTATIDQNTGMPDIDFSNDSWEANDNYAFNKFVLSPGKTDDKEFSAKVNVRFDGENSSYKMGLLGRFRDRNVDKNETELSEGPDIDLADWTVSPPSHRHNSLGQALSSSAMRDYWNQFGSEYSADEGDTATNAIAALAEDYAAKEDILAAYMMGTWDIGALRVIAGVRAENTSFSATGNSIDVEDDETFSVTQIKAHSSYTNVLPGLHVRWDGGDGWALRAALNKTVSRPGFGQIAPHATINNDDEEVELGNPNLDPYESTNLDFSFEKYLGESGIVSLGVFRKWIDGYIVDTVSNNNPDYAGYDVTSAINGDKAKVMGAEFNYQQNLDFLPAGWNGLLVGASGTWLDTDFDPGIEDRASDSFDLPRASKHVYSGYLGYEKAGLSVRVSAVYRSEYLDELGDGKAYDIYVAPNTQLDFGLSYQITNNVELYFDASNLLDKPLERYQGDSAHTQQYEEYGRTYAAGIKVKL
ncbi:TonB-dependent receptor [Pseudoxanthomonas sp. GM95]|uniref:TonB-dependent receptor n=1 Tax=Pseudoxanthomonas sp. GM95 TaxID=1881043 RepID=UPI0008CE06C1|nr:TonB-dependent receptor [Pseudoxanthomonas sp. GM95]SEK81920.1 TonB-dependent receptor [Pseudoxanthomonas sp. GM95]